MQLVFTNTFPIERSRARNIDQLQCYAPIKCTFPNARDCIRDCERDQCCASAEFPLLIGINESGITIEVSEEQQQNTFSLMPTSESEILIEANEVHISNAPSPTIMTEADSEMEVSAP